MQGDAACGEPGFDKEAAGILHNPDHTRCGILNLDVTDLTTILLECKAIWLHLNADAIRC